MLLIYVNLFFDIIGFFSDGSTEKTLTELLLDYGKRAIEQDTRSYLLVSRRDFLTTTFRGLQRSSFNLKGNLYVKFSGEEGLDHGGPRREFFRLVSRVHFYMLLLHQ